MASDATTGEGGAGGVEEAGAGGAESAEGGGAPAAKCEATSRLDVLHIQSRPSSEPLGDLTGDGAIDTATLEEPFLDVGTFRLDLRNERDIETFAANVAVQDLDADGQADLVVSLFWSAEVFVYFGPLTGERSVEDFDLRFRGPESSREGLTQFGIGHVLTDVNQDGALDFVVTAPSYVEVWCRGQLPPAVFFGPFESRTYEFDEALHLSGGAYEITDLSQYHCLGQLVWCTEEGFALGATEDTEEGPFNEVAPGEWRSCNVYPVRLGDIAPRECEVWPGAPR